VKYRIRICHGTEVEELTGPGVIDEIVIEKWLHLEQMDRNLYYLLVGNTRIMVDTKIRQKPTVTIYHDDEDIDLGESSR
jgi:hypothetical protein